MSERTMVLMVVFLAGNGFAAGVLLDWPIAPGLIAFIVAWVAFAVLCFAEQEGPNA